MLLMAACLCAACRPDAGRLSGRGAETVPGLDVFLDQPPDRLAGKRIGLITNQTGIDRHGNRNVDLIAARPDLELSALFAFEHGLTGAAPPGERIASTVDAQTGLPVHSLYGEVRRPTPEMLEGIGVLVYDVQGVGARTYTRLSTMALAMEAAGEAGIPFVVLDRPNPIGGATVEGGRLDPAFASFVGMYPIPLRHGLTVGELALMINREFGVKVDLTVVPVSAWRRSMWFDDTGLPWVPTSPNIRRLEAALHYPGTVLWEGTNLSEGRGTDLPFEQTGAPWLRADEVADSMNAMHLPGVRFEVTRFRIDETAGKYPGLEVPGVRLHLTDREAYRPVSTALLLIDVIFRLHREEFAWGPTIDRLAGTDRVRLAIGSGRLQELLAEWDRDVDRFHEDRAPYLLYP
jgi:uncharacterized protein YbbC (DUF1343 family)